MMLAAPDQRSRTVLVKLHLALIACIVLLFGIFTVLLLPVLSIVALPLACLLTSLCSSLVELGIVWCNRPRFRANAFLRQSYQNLINYERSYSLYSLIYMGLLILLFHIPTSAVVQLFLPEVFQSAANPAGAGGALFALGYFLAPIIALIALCLALPALALLCIKLLITAIGVYEAHQGRLVTYPLTLPLKR